MKRAVLLVALASCTSDDVPPDKDTFFGKLWWSTAIYARITSFGHDL